MLKESLLLALFLINGAMLERRYDEYGGVIYDDDYSDEDETTFEACDNTKCLKPNCTCFGKQPPKGLHVDNVPQFVMLTFDDAVNPVNIETYRGIRNAVKLNTKGCPIQATFFVTHEYNDYTLVNELYKEGHEIAVHSISHESNTEMWKTANETRWTNEMVGMKTILHNIARIPESEIVGHRAPFLQTAGDTTFKVLKENGFVYDSSLPTRSHIDPPLWPYTLDNGYPQDCQIEPCPKKSYPGFWEFPMVQWKKITPDGTYFHCSMLDACTPQPASRQQTVQYLSDNFNRHYRTNKAPLPVFLHEAWLRNDAGRHSPRYDGLVAFLREIVQKPDVFVVSVKEVLDYMREPVNLEDYKAKPCVPKTRPPALSCDSVSSCHYPRRQRYMKSCVPCPKRYPWVANPNGN